jgi:hypothetical protein
MVMLNTVFVKLSPQYQPIICCIAGNSVFVNVNLEPNVVDIHMLYLIIMAEQSVPQDC